MQKALASHQCGPGGDAIMWVEFLVGFCYCSDVFFLGTWIFLPLQKMTFSNSNLISKQLIEETLSLFYDLLVHLQLPFSSTLSLSGSIIET